MKTFNWQNYIQNYPDLKAAGITTRRQAIKHWVMHGQKENRTDKLNKVINLTKNKVLIIYVYYERKNEQKNQTNLAFFIKHGLNKANWSNIDITTLFVINGHQCEVLIPNEPDIFILKEDNCSDWEGWYNGIKYIENKYNTFIYNIFTHICLINCSAFGPYIKPNTFLHWLDPFFNKLNETGSVACSPCINLMPETEIH